METKLPNQDETADQVAGARIVEKPATAAGRRYRYKRFTTKLLLRDMRFRKGAPKSGDLFPEFRLTTLDGDALVKRDLVGKRPVLFIFGSVTCPMTASAMPFLKRLHIEFGDRVEFIMLNVREAHPGENFGQPTTMAEKLDHARALKHLFEIPWVVAADDIEGSLHQALDPKPNSAFLMDKGGVIIFRSLWASDQNAMRPALISAVAGRTPDKLQSQVFLGPVVKAMGRVQETMDRAGPQASRDMWLGALPMALAGRVATLFSPLTADQRGIASALTLGLAASVGLGLISSWVFG